MKNIVEIKESNSNVCGSISWEKLSTILKHAGELRQHEELTKIKIDKDGINYYVQDIDRK